MSSEDNPPVWFPEHGRHLTKLWDESYRRYYWTHYKNDQWVFFDWCPETLQHIQSPPASPTSSIDLHPKLTSGSRAQAEPAGYDGEDEMLQGTPSSPPEGNHGAHRSAFHPRTPEFFTAGRVFSILYTEAARGTARAVDQTLPELRHNKRSRAQFRRFVVVKQKRDFCFAIPLLTYNNKATSQLGVVPNEHAIAYSWGYGPQLLPSEQPLVKDPICIIMAHGVSALPPASRIFFGYQYPIQYKNEVKDIGYVHPDWLQTLLGYWSMVNQDISSQEATVTAEGAAFVEEESQNILPKISSVITDSAAIMEQESIKTSLLSGSDALDDAANIGQKTLLPSERSSTGGLSHSKSGSYAGKQPAQSSGSSWTKSIDLGMVASSVTPSQEDILSKATSMSDSHASFTSRPLERQVEAEENASVVSYDTIDMTPTEDTEVVANFTAALYQNIRIIDFLFDGSSTTLGTLLDVKIKNFSQIVKRDNPRNVNDRKPRRKIAKAIGRLSLRISNRFAQRLFNDNQGSIETMSNEDLERPLLEYDIPVESIEQKMQRMEAMDCAPQSNIFATSQDDEGGPISHSSSSSHPSVLPTRPDFGELHGYFKEHPAFETLTSAIHQLIKHFYYDVLEHIKYSVSQTMVKKQSSAELSREVWEAHFHADWDLLLLLKERRDGGLKDDLTSILTITGNTQEAQLETVGDFIRQTWGPYKDALLPALQEAISSPNMSHSKNELPNIRVTLSNALVSVLVTGSTEFLIAVAQQLAWLGATCRPRCQRGQTVTKREPQYCDTVWKPDDSASTTFNITYVTAPIDEDEPSPSWIGLFDGPCIAPGYIISERFGGEVGLQLPFKFLGIRKAGLETSAPQEGRPAGSSTSCFIDGGLTYDLGRVFQNQPRTLIFLESEVESNFCFLDSFRQSLIQLRGNHEPTDFARAGVRSSDDLDLVVAELLDADVNSIDWCCSSDTGYSDILKSNLEDWTKEEWDWWPFKRPRRALRSTEARLSWTSVYGEEGWAEVPVTFAKMAIRIAKAFATHLVTTTSLTEQQFPHVNLPQLPPPTANPQRHGQKANFTGDSQSNAGPGSPSGDTRIETDPSMSKTTLKQPLPPPQLVFLLVGVGKEFRLAQIRVETITTYQFFQQLRYHYNNLRPFLRRRLSIWVYSHCDFHRCDKFESHSYEPVCLEFPDDRVPQEYQYEPNPMGTVPPIGRLQFYKRFYTCYNPRPMLHFYHTCFPWNKSEGDHLKSFPKRGTTLIEDSDKKEIFWGITARERPSVFRLFMYNFLSASPCIGFFFMWLFSWGHGGDLQNASIPITIMLICLSTFWSIFFAEVKFMQGNVMSER